jgi:UPF0755 protein
VKRRLIICLALIFPVLGIAAWLRYEAVTPFYGGSAPETYVDIPYGAGIYFIASQLKVCGALHYELPFVLYVRWAGISRQIKAGEYLFRTAASPVQIAQRLVRGDVYYRTVTIPEGLTAREIAGVLFKSGLGNENQLKEQILRADWIADLDPAATSLEGYLFPETYRFSRHTTSEQLLKSMTVQFRERMKALLAEHPLPAGWTVPRILTLASMIEKEARTAEERKLVASVLTNRLRLKMPLACDPTLIYALKQAGTYDGNLRKTDLAMDSPYNSYRHPGLPPTPIANPGENSIRAALDPAFTHYLYYVSRNDGTHVFSTDLRSHLLAVDRFQRRQNR